MSLQVHLRPTILVITLLILTTSVAVYASKNHTAPEQPAPHTAIHPSKQPLKLAANDPIAYAFTKVNGLRNASGFLRFKVTPVSRPAAQAQPFFQGSGMALAFTEIDNRTYLSAYDASGTGEWRYSELPHTDKNKIKLTLYYNRKQGHWAVWIGNQLALKDLGLSPLSESKKLLLFQGHEESPTHISHLSYAHKRPALLKALQPPNPIAHYRKAKTLQDYFLNDDSTLIRRHGELIRPSDAFRVKIAQLPSTLQQLPVDKVIFVDNRIGSDTLAGDWPMAHGKHGPKASLAEAFRCAPDGGAIVLLNGFGVYLEPLPPLAQKSLTLIPIGDNHIGSISEIERVI